MVDTTGIVEERHRDGDTLVSRVICVDLGALVLVPCPRCDQPIGQDTHSAGSSHRYRCKRCHDFATVSVVSVDPAGETVIVLCPKCKQRAGRSFMVPGETYPYQCKSCAGVPGEWVVIAAVGELAEAPPAAALPSTVT